ETIAVVQLAVEAVGKPARRRRRGLRGGEAVRVPHPVAGMKVGDALDRDVALGPDAEETGRLLHRFEQQGRARALRADDEQRPVEPLVDYAAAFANRRLAHEARRWRAADAVTAPLASAGARAGAKISESSTFMSSDSFLSNSLSP